MELIEETFVITSLLIAIALAMDAFSICVGAGAYFTKTTYRQKFRLSFHFGLFQFLMPIVGWFLGLGVLSLLEKFDHWIAFLILGAIGVKMFLENPEHKQVKNDITRGYKLVALAIATSIDALAVGFSLSASMDNSKIFIMASIIGITTFAISLAGIKFGEKISTFSLKFANKIAGIILILIGLQIVFKHLEVI